MYPGIVPPVFFLCKGPTPVIHGAMGANGYEDEAALRQRIEAAAKENSRLRGLCADKEFEASQLEKQLRRLERKIAAFDAKPSTSLAKGFLKPASTTTAVPQASPKPRSSGIIIDGLTGKEVDPKTLWEESKESNILLRTPELELMHAMQNPPETNSEFDSNRYTQLISEGRQAEAEAMIQAEGGPSLAQMQREPLELLRKYPQLDANWSDPRIHGCSLLQWACSMGYEDVARRLLALRADCSHRSAGTSCLAAAMAHSWPGCAGLLLEARADANEVAEPTGKQTLLMWASRIDYVDAEGRGVPSPLVALLLQHRAEVQRRDARGQTALMHAATHGSELAVEALLAARAEVDAEDQEGNTALQIALRYYHGKIASILIPLRRRDDGQSAKKSWVGQNRIGR
ncbi:unnamed protein product [Effrenium voratum]|nr:unnamed protein product [Effrenium voratum]